jgi:hypothetical protein
LAQRDNYLSKKNRAMYRLTPAVPPTPLVSALKITNVDTNAASIYRASIHFMQKVEMNRPKVKMPCAADKSFADFESLYPATSSA